MASYEKAELETWARYNIHSGMSETMAKEATDIEIFAFRGCESIGITR